MELINCTKYKREKFPVENQFSKMALRTQSFVSPVQNLSDLRG